MNYVRLTIGEILRDPRYRQFAADCTAAGRMIIPDGFPWKYMGLADDEFLAMDLRYAGSRKPVPADTRVKWLAVVRQAERDVEECWIWWGGWTAAAIQLGRYRPAVIAGELPSAAAAPVGGQVFLF